MHTSALITVRNEVAKVMFLHLSVHLSFCSQGGVPGQVPPTPREQVHTPRQVHPQAGTPPQQVHPQQVHPLAGTPPGRYTPGQVHSPGRRLLLQTVRILLECILVSNVFSFTEKSHAKSWQQNIHSDVFSFPPNLQNTRRCFRWMPTACLLTVHACRTCRGRGGPCRVRMGLGPGPCMCRNRQTERQHW